MLDAGATFEAHLTPAAIDELDWKVERKCGS